MLRADNRGGRRAGAGRKPGGKSVALMRREMQPPAEIHTALGQLPGPVQTAIHMHVHGATKAWIAKQLEKDPHTIASWLDGNPAAIREAAKQLASPQDASRPMVPDAWGAVWDIARDVAPDHVGPRLSAANSILDRHYGKAVVRAEISGLPPPQIVIITGPLTPEDDPDYDPVIEGRTVEAERGDRS